MELETKEQTMDFAPGVRGYVDHLKKRITAGNTGEFASLGDFLRSVARAANKGQYDARLDAVKTKTMAEGTDSLGGFTVPETFSAQVLFDSLGFSVVRPRATVLPMASDTLKIPAISDASHATNVFGGIQCYWEAEGAAHTPVDFELRQVALHAKKLIGYLAARNEWLEDSLPSADQLIQTLFAQAMAWYEDGAFLFGTGAGQPLGIFNSGAIISVPARPGQLADSVIYGNIVDMLPRLTPNSFNNKKNVCWVANQDVLPQLLQLAETVGISGQLVWVPQALTEPPDRLFGRQVLYSEHMQTLGDQGDIGLFDFSYYVIAQRKELQVEISRHVLFTTDSTVFRFRLRVDGQPWVDSPLTPKNSAATVSPFIVLDERA